MLDVASSKTTQADDAVLNDGLVWADVRGAIVTQCRVIHALILRETLSRYGDHKLGFMWAILEPLFFVTVIAGSMAAMRTDMPSGMPLVQFMITGFVPFIMFRNAMNQQKNAVSANRSLLGFPQVTIFDVIAARMLLETAVMLFVFALLVGMAHLVGYEVHIEDPLGVLAACLALIMIGSGIGFILATLMPVIPSVGQIAGILFGRPLFLTSGLFFTASSIPEPFRGWLLYNPLLHLMELLRSSFFYEFESNYGSWTYAGSWALGSFAFGMLTYQALKRRAIIGL